MMRSFPSCRPLRFGALLAIGAVAILTAGCRDERQSYEGDDPKECSDNADNDRDGLWDCDDDGCAGSPDCSSDGDDTGGDTGTVDPDADGDGFPQSTDCDDSDDQVNPDAQETPYNGRDDDCSPATPDDDLDGDGAGVATDCDDSDDSVGPDAVEQCHLLVGATAGVGGEFRDMGFGSDILLMGDQDGDGVEDVAVGAPGWDRSAGAVLLLSGATLASSTGARRRDSTESWARLTGRSNFDSVGTGGSLHALPDRSGDGRAELVVGAPFMDPGGFSNSGVVWVFTDIAELSGEAIGDSAATTTIQGRNTGDKLGSALSVGDLTGDGVADLLLTSPQDDSLYSNAGLVAVFDGSTLVEGVVSVADADGFLAGDWNERVGVGQTRLVGDVDGDGAAEIAVGSQESDSSADLDTGLVYLVPASAIPTDGSLVAIHSAAAATFEGEAFGDGFGNELLGPGDLDGDGIDDLLITALQGDLLSTDGGTLNLWWGGGLSGRIPASTADLRWGGQTGLSRTGSGLAAADFDADDQPDVLVASPYRAQTGRLYGLSGADHGGWSGGALDEDAALWVSAMGSSGPTLGRVTDLDGNGAPDLLVGAPEASTDDHDGAGELLLFQR